MAIDGGGFRWAVGERRGGVSQLRWLGARKHQEVEIEVELGDDDQPNRWSYALVFTNDSSKRPVLRREIVKRDGEMVLERPRIDDEEDGALLGQTHLEQIAANREFRELPEFFRSIRYLHIVPQLIREPERPGSSAGDPFGRDLIERIAAASDKSRTTKPVKITKALKIAVPQLKDLEIVRDNRGVPHLQGRYEHWRAHGAKQQETSFSDGTLRLLGLLWAMLEGGGPLLLEEPELSLHPAVVRRVAGMIAQVQGRGGAQVLLSTHSADLLDEPGIGVDEVHLLTPEQEGTMVTTAGTVQAIKDLLQGGLSLGEAALPRVAPVNAAQLNLALS